MTEIREVPASEPGALSGFAATCACGMELRSSLRTALELDVAAHLEWHAGPSGRHREPRQTCCRCLRSCEPVVTIEFLYAPPPQLGRRRFHYCSDDAVLGRREYEQDRTSPTFSEVHLIDRAPAAVQDNLETYGDDVANEPDAAKRDERYYGQADELDAEAADDRDAKHRAALEGSERQ